MIEKEEGLERMGKGEREEGGGVAWIERRQGRARSSPLLAALEGGSRERSGDREKGPLALG